MRDKKASRKQVAPDSRRNRAGHSGCSSQDMDPDLRYERPVKWLLATGAAINWVAAMLVVLNNQEEEFFSRYASDVARWLAVALG